MTDIIADIFGAFAGSLIVYFKWPTWQKEWRYEEKRYEPSIESSSGIETKKLSL